MIFKLIGQFFKFQTKKEVIQDFVKILPYRKHDILKSYFLSLQNLKKKTAQLIFSQHPTKHHVVFVFYITLTA